MQKILFAAMLVGAGSASSAYAQSNVTIYGIVDAAYVRESGGAGGTVNKLTSGAAAASRIGFRGTEDLGGGITALFQLENGFRVDTGEVDVGGTIFNRQAFVGLRSAEAGTLTLGRQYTPWHQALTQIGDPFQTGTAGTSRNLFPDYGTNVRSSNTIMYTAPPYQGFTGDLAYSPGEQAGSNDAGRQFGASIGYLSGPIAVRLAYNNRNFDVAPAPGVTPLNRGIATNTLLVASYDFTVAKVHFAWGRDRGFNSSQLGNTGNPFGGVPPTASTHATDLLLGVTAPAGPGTFLASIMRKNDRSAFNQDANSWGIGYLYPLSKRTNLYAAYGSIDNKNGAGYTVANNTEVGSGDRAFNLGVRHSF
jgi:predicted porin